MAQNEFLRYVEKVHSPERSAIFKDAIEALFKAGLIDIEFHIDQMMTEGDIEDGNGLVAKVEAILIGSIWAALNQCGIQLHDEVGLSLATDILQGVLRLDNWSDPETLSALCDMEETPDVILGAMLEVVGTRHESEYINAFSYVSESLVDRIDQVNNQPTVENMPDHDVRERAIQRVERLLDMVAAPILSQAIRDLLLFGGSYQGILENYGDGLQELNLDQVIPELVGFACASELTNDALSTAVLEKIQGWFNERSDDTSRAYARVAALLTEVTKP